MILRFLLPACIIYAGLFRPFVVKRHKFKCQRCGRCCRYKLELSKEDILRLEKAGAKDFITDKAWVKRMDGNCVFLKTVDGGNRCAVYEARPEVCRWWPVRKYRVDIRCKAYDRKFF